MFTTPYFNFNHIEIDNPVDLPFQTLRCKIFISIKVGYIARPYIVNICNNSNSCKINYAIDIVIAFISGATTWLSIILISNKFHRVSHSIHVLLWYGVRVIYALPNVNLNTFCHMNMKAFNHVTTSLMFHHINMRHQVM